MKTMTATALRADLFRTIQGVVRGAPVRIRSRWGTVLLCREKDSPVGADPANTLSSPEPKVPGRIVGSLSGADRDLRTHIRVPT